MGENLLDDLFIFLYNQQDPKLPPIVLSVAGEVSNLYAFQHENLADLLITPPFVIYSVGTIEQPERLFSKRKGVCVLTNRIPSEGRQKAFFVMENILNIDFVDTELYGILPAPKTMAQISEVMEWYRVAHNHPIGWRGMANINWKVTSALDREWRKEAENYAQMFPHNTVENYFRMIEFSLLNEARRNGYGYRDGRELSDLELLAVLQHYGAATRLIDFSKNAWVGLWFATNQLQYINHTGVVLCAPYSNHARIGEIRDLKFEKLPIGKILSTNIVKEEIGIELEHLLQDIFFWNPPHLYERMRVQHSFFMLGPHVQNLDWCSFRAEKPNFNENLGDFLAIAIPPELKKDMANKWETHFGFNVRTLFPDLSGFAQHWSYTTPLSKSDDQSS